jgi:plasmid stabilization system protein ParE
VKYALHPGAVLEHKQQIAYYQDRQRGLGQRYHAAFRAALELACATPERFKIVRPPAIRKVVLRGFPFDVVYRQTGEVIQVLAIAHHRRRPEYWAKRL